MPKKHYIFKTHSVMFDRNSLPLTSDGTQRNQILRAITG